MRHVVRLPSILAALACPVWACTDSELAGQPDRDGFHATEPDSAADSGDETAEVHVGPACSTDEACVAFFASQLSPCEVAFCDNAVHRCDTRRRDHCCESALDCQAQPGEAPGRPVSDPGCQIFTCPTPGGSCQMTDICSGCSLDSECQSAAPLCSRGRCGEGQCTFEPVPTCCVDASDCDDADPCTDATCDPGGVCRYHTTGREGCCTTAPVLDTSFAPAPHFDARSSVTDVRWSALATTFTPTPPAALYLGNPIQLQLVSAEGPIRADVHFDLGPVTPNANIEVKFQAYLDIRAPLDVDRFRVILRSAQGEERLVLTKVNAALGLWQPVKRVFFVTSVGPWELVAEFDGVTATDVTHFGIFLDDLQVRAGCSIQTCGSDAECPSEDPCVRGFCNGGTCGYAQDPNCQPGCHNDDECRDQSACTEDRCLGTQCVHKSLPGCCQSDEACADGNPCTADRCDLQSGFCRYDTSGLCVGCNPPDCNDFDPCTRDFCDLDRCAHVFDPTVAPFCGGCDPMHCDDGNPCTRDVCGTSPAGAVMCSNVYDPNLFGCQTQECQTNEDCRDGTPCTQNTCDSAGHCVRTPLPNCCQTQAECADNDPCTQEKCDPGAGLCFYYEDPLCSVCDPTRCYDNDPCTRDDCDGPFCMHSFDPSIPGCTGCDPAWCDDGDPCTRDFCPMSPDPDDGPVCINLYVPTLPGCQLPECLSNQDCRDGTPCTQDLCDASGRCSHPPVPNCCQTAQDCADNDPCTLEKCDTGAGLCYFYDDPMCNVCDPALCSDNDPCTRDACEGPFCTHTYDPALTGCGPGCHSVRDCDDNNSCTEDSCLADGTCFYQRIPGCATTCTAASCNDGNPCTRDTCLTSGSCANDFDPTIPGCYLCYGVNDPACDDGNPCTDDSCDLVLGCVHWERPNRTPCIDNDPCTSDDACFAGECYGGAPVSCASDGDPCTSDYCDRALGCVYVRIPNCGTTCTAAGCDDGNLCTKDGCTTDGRCINELIPGCSVACANGCDDGNPCTRDVCTATGVCNNLARSGFPCDDGSACTVGDVCSDGVCMAGMTVSCSDGDPCTGDRCNPLTGCEHERLPIPGCGPICTGCDDGNPCTTDNCDSASGVCSHTSVAGCCTSGSQCADGDLCTSDTCEQNTCKHARLDIPLCQTTECQTAADCSGASQCTNVGCVDGQCRLEPIFGCCQSSLDCDDSDACTNDFCFAQFGVCLNTSVGCDDNDPCTIDACDRSVGCVHKPDPASCGCEEQKLWVRTFEPGETPDITIEGGGSMRWRVDEVRSQSPKNALRFGDASGKDYDNNDRVSGRGTGPTVAIPPEVSSATLDFWTYVDVDADPQRDYFRVRLLTGDGQNVILWERTSLSDDQYRTWIPISVTLPPDALGQDVQVRFVFDSVDGQGNNGQGVFIDDVVLRTTCP